MTSSVGILVGHRIRRDRLQVGVWALSTGALALFSASSIVTTYGDDAGRAGIVRLAVANPAILMLRGLPQGTALDAFVFFEIFTYLALMAAFMSTFLAVRHSRAEEEAGRAELIGATPAARTMPTVATVIHGLVANVLVGAAVFAGFAIGGLDAAGSAVAGLATTATGVAFVGVGLLAAQLTRSSRGANGLSSALVGAAFLVRGIGDALGEPSADGLSMMSAWPSWLSPIGWAQHSFAYTANDLTPLLLAVALAVVTVGLVLALQSRRDSGASLIAARAGRSSAPAALSSPFGLAVRLQRSAIIGWSVGGAVFGFFGGSLAGLVEQASSDGALIEDALRSLVVGTSASLSQVLIAAMFTLVGFLAAACATQAVIRLRQEEASGTAELLLATPVSRLRWMGSYLVLGAASILIVLLSGAVAAAIAVMASGDDPARIGDSFQAAAAQLPAALLYLGAMAAIVVILPRLTIVLGWTTLAAGVFLGEFGGLMNLPEWLRNLSPFAHTPVIIGGETDWSGGVWMTALSAIAFGVAVACMSRRELEGS